MATIGLVNGILTTANTPTYGGIYVADGSTAQEIATGATYTKVTCFTADQASSGCTPAHGDDQITLTKAGKYLVTLSWSGAVETINSTWDFAAFLGTTEQNQVHASRKFSNNDIGSLCCSGVITAAAGDVLTFRAKHDQGSGDDLTTHDCSLTVVLVGA